MKTQVEDSREFGEYILSTQRLGTQVGRLKFATYAMAAVLAGSLIMEAVTPTPRPLLLDTSTGNIITNYKYVLKGYTAQERALLAEAVYEGFRRRTGNKVVDENSVNKWLSMFTGQGYEAWKNLGVRWTDPNVVRHGVLRTLQVVGTTPDASNEYAFTVEAIESESEEGKPLSHKTYRVRLTLFFTDPSIEGKMKINGVVLHEESLVK